MFLECTVNFILDHQAAWLRIYHQVQHWRGNILNHLEWSWKSTKKWLNAYFHYETNRTTEFVTVAGNNLESPASYSVKNCENVDVPDITEEDV